MSLPEGKFCPLLDGDFCHKEKCAWWNYFDEECCITTLATLATTRIGEAER